MIRFIVAAASTDPQGLSGFAGWAVDVIDRLGGLGAASLIALENLFPPLPSEVILPLTGFSAGSNSGNFTLIGAILWCTAGSVIGAWALYGVGVLLGRERTRWLMGKLPLVRTEDIERTEAFFDRRGMWTVFFGRMIPIFRSLISIPAGVTRMAFWKFTALTTAGSAIWNTVLIYAGYALGSNWTKVEGYISVFTKIVIVLVVLALIVWVALRLRANRNAKSADVSE